MTQNDRGGLLWGDPNFRRKSMSDGTPGARHRQVLGAFSASKLFARAFQCVIVSLWMVPLTVALLFLLSYFGLSFGSGQSDSFVRTPYGPVEGFGFEEAFVYLGIPFAKPPIAELRLERPERVEKWTETLQALEFGASCVTAAGWSGRRNEVLDENCLFMNVMRPKKESENAKGYPVFVFIYGGGYETGSSTSYGYKEIVRNFVSRGFVFVTFNYRLGPLGFATTEDSVLPGNLGLWDQKSALEFVKEVIPSFGGNPDEITISGESAGGSSVSALTLSPLTNGLFQRAIQMSGSLFCSFAFSERIGNQSRRLFQEIGCGGTSLEIKKCLKKKTLTDYADAHARIGPALDTIIGLRYNPRVDGEFLPTDLHSMIKAAPRIPTITGITTAEMGAFVLFNENRSLIDVPQRRWNSFNEDDLRGILARMSSEVRNLNDLVVRFYVERSDKKVFKNSSFYLTRLVEAAGDISFNVPVLQEALEKLESGWPVYLYLEEFYNTNGRENVPVKGAFHGNELAFLFGRLWKHLSAAKDEEGTKFKKNLLDGFTSFAISGEPVVGDVKWEPISRSLSDRYMALNVNSTMKNGLLKERFDFWTKEVPKQVDVDEMKKYLLPGARKRERSDEL